MARLACPADRVTIDEAYKLGLEKHRAGNLADAEKVYRQILSQNPRHDPSLNMMGVIALQVGRADLAAQTIGRAIVQQPLVAEYHLNLGAALDKLGRVDEAVESYRKALTLKADYVQALSNLGNGLRRQGDLAQAVAVCRRALAVSPEFAEAHHNLGVALLASGQNDIAIEALAKAVSLRPQSVEFLFVLAGALAAAGRFAEAITVYRSTIGKRPIHAQAWSDLGEALRKTGQYEAAVAAGEQAVLLQPDWAAGLVQLGKAYYEVERLDDAIKVYQRAIKLADTPEARNNLGATLHAYRRWDEAISEFKRAIELSPNYAEAFNNLGSSLKRKGQIEEAVAAFEKAIAMQPAYPAAHWNLAHMLLVGGDFDRGWREYEWRWHTEEIKPTKNLSALPMWDGGPLNGKRILLHAEQGLGDAIQFVRYVPIVARAGGKIILAIPAALRRLLEMTWPPGSEIGSAIVQWMNLDEPVPAHDVQCALMSLPLILHTNLSSIPGDVPYLRVDSGLSAKWRACVADVPGRKVGLVWAGRRSYGRDVERSIAPDKFAPLAEVADISWISLQKSDSAAAAENSVNSPIHLLDWTSELTDLAETAALMENLDLVISVDTAVAHLAGAMGRPVWVLLPKMPDWRWLLERGDSPWYPTMRLFRQSVMNQWSDVIEDVAQSLRGI